MATKKKEKKSIFKRWWFWLIIVVVVVGVAAGSGDKDDSKTSNDTQSQSPVQSSEPSTSQPLESSVSPSNENSGEGDLGDYHVQIKGAKLVQDYDGNPAIVITYDWTNNSDDTTSAMVAVHEQAFQDGVELSPAFIVSDEYSAENSMKDVRPGTTLEIQCAFELTSETSTVEFEISELISFSSDKVSMNFNPSEL